MECRPMAKKKEPKTPPPRIPKMAIESPTGRIFLRFKDPHTTVEISLLASDLIAALCDYVLSEEAVADDLDRVDGLHIVVNEARIRRKGGQLELPKGGEPSEL